MTITSQTLRGNPKRTFKRILQKHKRLSKAKQKALTNALAQITKDAISSSGLAVKSQINAKMAELIKARILNKREFNPEA